MIETLEKFYRQQIEFWTGMLENMDEQIALDNRCIRHYREIGDTKEVAYWTKLRAKEYRMRRDHRRLIAGYEELLNEKIKEEK